MPKNLTPPPTEPTPPVTPEIPSEVPPVAPIQPQPGTRKIRASEVVIIITVIFSVVICVLLVLGAIALVRNFPVWWKQLFGMPLNIWFV